MTVGFVSAPEVRDVVVHADYVAAAVVVVVDRAVVAGVSAKGGPVAVVSATVVAEDSATRTTRFALEADRTAAPWTSTLTVTAQAAGTSSPSTSTTLTLPVPARA